MSSLKNNGVGTQVHYIPLFYQPYYSRNITFFSGAIKYYNSTLSIPMYTGLKSQDINYITSTIIKIISE